MSSAFWAFAWSILDNQIHCTNTNATAEKSTSHAGHGKACHNRASIKTPGTDNGGKFNLCPEKRKHVRKDHTFLHHAWGFKQARNRISFWQVVWECFAERSWNDYWTESRYWNILLFYTRVQSCQLELQSDPQYNAARPTMPLCL